MKEAPKHLPQLDGLRAIAIMMVFVHHAFQIPLLWTGVDLFFILSGYLITGILLRDRDRMGFSAMLGKFYLRRAQRILPAYAVCITLLVFFTTLNWRSLWVYYAFFLQNIPYAFGWVTSGPVIPLWSLGVEQQFYIFWPVVIYFAPRRWLPRILTGLLLFTPLLRALCTPLFVHSEPIYSLTPFRLDTLAAGALAAVVLPRCNPARVRTAGQIAMGVGIALYAVLSPHPWFRRTPNTVEFNTMAYSLNILVLGGLFLWVVSTPEGWLQRLLSNRVLGFLGRISYMFYLLHLLILVEADRFLGRVPGAIAAFLITTGCAALSWFVLEKPILSLGMKNRQLERRAEIENPPALG